MSWPNVIKRINAGEEVVLHPKGNSMRPRIKSGERIVLSSVDAKKLELNDIVLAKVKGRYYLHLISKIEGDKIEISNNHGWCNGTTSRDKIYAIVSEIG